MNQTEALGGALKELSAGQLRRSMESGQLLQILRQQRPHLGADRLGGLVFCTLAAYAFARMEFWGKNLLFTLLLATLMLPEAVAWAPNFITVSWLGRVGPVPWINSWPALTIPFMASAFAIFLVRQFFQQIPNDLLGFCPARRGGPPALSAPDHGAALEAPIMTLVLFGFIASWKRWRAIW